MKNIILIAVISIAANTFSYAQNQVTDTHPGATIYIYDPQSGQEVLADNNEAILFKDAVVDLVSNTGEARMVIRTSPGRKSILVTQAAPADGNAYQIEMDSKLFGQTTTLYTFSYNVDQNTLYFYDTGSQSWITEQIRDNNVNNLNNCLSLGKFNDPQNWNQPTDDGIGDSPVQASTPPPPLQEYEQPECPVDGYLWQPGYWAFNRNEGYYWVAGTWVAPPSQGYLWTPPYWGFEGGVYAFHGGYWGVSIGFYGGINYGYGYGGRGFYGGGWEGGHFRYNTAVVRVNVNVVHNTYVDRTIIVNNTTVNNKKVSFNGPGGAVAKPTPEEAKVASLPHVKDHSQDPKAAKTTVVGQKGNNPNVGVGKTTNGNVQRTPGAANNTNQPRAPRAANSIEAGNAPKVPGSGPGVPKAPGSGSGTRQNGQRQAPQGQNTQRGGGKQPAKTEKASPTSDDKKKPNN